MEKVSEQQKDGESPEKVAPPRSPNSIEFHRRMQKILEKQEIERQRRSPRRDKKADPSISPRLERQAKLPNQVGQKNPKSPTSGVKPTILYIV